MSSVVIFNHKGVVVEWNKHGPYTVRDGDKVVRYKSRADALSAALRKTKRIQLTKKEERP